MVSLERGFRLFLCCGDVRYLHSFPTRRSSDLDHDRLSGGQLVEARIRRAHLETKTFCPVHGTRCERPVDRKSTRLNSSHPSISYAVFCLKKKKTSPGLNRTVRTRACAGRRAPP